MGDKVAVAGSGVGVGVFAGVGDGVTVGVPVARLTDCGGCALATLKWIHVTAKTRRIRLLNFNPRLTFSHHVI